MKKQSCDQISNLTLMNIIEKKYYQWINHLSTDPEHDKQSLGIDFILFR